MDRLVVGLTGMSGSGKSTVSQTFAENGFDIIDCDSCAREITALGSPFLMEFTEYFGDGFILPDGNLDRQAVSELIFHDPKKRQLYNKIIYPYITYNIIVKIKKSHSRLILLDAPTLFEARLDFLCGKIISVIADVNVCAERIVRRDNISEELALARLKSQHDAEFFRLHSDFCLENNGKPEGVAGQQKKFRSG